MAVMKEKAKERFQIWRAAAAKQAETVREAWKNTTSRGADSMREVTRRRAHEVLDRGLAILLSPWKLFKLLCFSVGFLVVLVSALLGYSVYGFFQSLPQVDRMTFKDLVERASIRVNERLEDKRKRYRWVPLKRINRDLVFSIVLSEDATFFEHDGFNFEAMVDSLAENIKERRAAFGASTISQQVVKNVFLTNEKTFFRKFKEAILTRSLEAKFDKNEILEVYLNIAEFGPDIFGVNAASHAFFRKRPDQINAAEGAFMALMLPSPRRRYYTIFENRNLSSHRRRHIDRVLRDMFYTEFITDAEYQRYRRWRYFDGVRVPARSR